MKAVITVVGKDRTGIIAKVSGLLFDKDINILDISQTIMQDIFCMIMLVGIPGEDSNLNKLRESLEELGKEMGVTIHIQSEEIFGSMHRI